MAVVGSRGTMRWTTSISKGDEALRAFRRTGGSEEV